MKRQRLETLTPQKTAGQNVYPHVKYIAVVKTGTKIPRRTHLHSICLANRAGASVGTIVWRKTLANIKSQIKRNRQNENRRLRNRNIRGAARTAVNQARSSYEANEPETKEAILKAISMLDKAAEKGVIHKNNAARRKGRLMKKLASFASGTSPAATKSAKKTSK